MPDRAIRAVTERFGELGRAMSWLTDKKPVDASDPNFILVMAAMGSTLGHLVTDGYSNARDAERYRDWAGGTSDANPTAELAARYRLLVEGVESLGVAFRFGFATDQDDIELAIDGECRNRELGWHDNVEDAVTAWLNRQGARAPHDWHQGPPIPLSLMPTHGWVGLLTDVEGDDDGLQNYWVECSNPRYSRQRVQGGPSYVVASMQPLNGIVAIGIWGSERGNDLVVFRMLEGSPGHPLGTLYVGDKITLWVDPSA